MNTTNPTEKQHSTQVPFAVIGDVHGCFEEFQDLVELIRYRFGRRIPIVSLGDLLDKGPKGPECVAFAREQGIAVIKANHEEWGLRWLAHEKRKESDPSYVNPMKTKLVKDLEELKRLKPEDVSFLKNLPLYYRFGDYVLVHGGLQPSIPLDKQDPKKVIRLRWVDQTGDHVAVDYEKDHGEPPKEGAKYWMQMWDGDFHVVYGHEAHSYTEVRIDTNSRGFDCIGIDTAAVHGGFLTAMVVDGNNNRTFLQVRAREVYLDADKHRATLRSNKSQPSVP